MKFFAFPALLALLFLAASCTEERAVEPKSDQTETRAFDPGVSGKVAGGAGDLRPGKGKIANDVVALVRSTKVIPEQTPSAECPECPAGGTDVFTFRNVQENAVSCVGDACTVTVTISVVFNPGAGGTIVGGLTGWIAPEQRSAYLRGEAPSGDQFFPVQIVYRLREGVWYPVDFDRAPAG